MICLWIFSIKYSILTMAPALPFIGIKVSDRRLRSTCPPHADEAAVLLPPPCHPPTLRLRDFDALRLNPPLSATDKDIIG